MTKRKKPPAGSTPSEQDMKLLARLVAKYGREAIADLVHKVPLPRDRGRPPRSYFLYEAIDFAEAFAELVEKLSKGKRSKAAYEAELELFRKEFDRNQERSPVHFKRWQYRARKKRGLGQRALLALREAEAAGLVAGMGLSTFIRQRLAGADVPKAVDAVFKAIQGRGGRIIIGK